MYSKHYVRSQPSEELPISACKDLIVDKIIGNQVVIIHGETGSGKTTKIPQYLYELDLNRDKMIGITQPRRISAVNVSKWVAKEMQCGLGKEVGYEIRFDNRSSASTMIKFMTDGILLNQCIRDPELREYNIIIVDEAHERSLRSDVLLGLLKTIIKNRKDLKLVITSATMDTKKLSSYFLNAPIVYVSGHKYDVDIIYEPNYYMDLVTHSSKCVTKIHNGSEPGDILVFLTGQDEVERCVESLNGIRDLVPLPLYSAMEFDEQQKVFNKLERFERKVVVATNIAETGITIDGIRFIVDCGYVKQSNYKANMGLDVWEDVKISKAQANQRKGRTGRTSNGWCYRLYSEDAYNKFLDIEIPEIQRKLLTEIYLKVVAFGLNPMTFNFLDPPDHDTLLKGQIELKDLKFLDKYGNITEDGRLMEDFPVEPSIGKILLTSIKKNCVGEIVIILAMISERNIFKRPRKLCKIADSKRSQFNDFNGDLFTLLRVYKMWLDTNKSEKWCKDNFIDFKIMEKVCLIRDQFIDILKRKGNYKEPSSIVDVKAIKESIYSAYFKNICIKGSGNFYFKIHGGRENLYIHPSSSLFNMKPQCILYMDIRKTSKPFMHGCIDINDIYLRNTMGNLHL